MELLVKLGINWQLLAAQVVNFFIVMGALTFFLYRPILNLLDARAEKIRKSMEDVKRIENQAKELDELREREMKKLDAEAGQYLEKVRGTAEKVQADIVVAAQKEAENIVRHGQQWIDSEKQKMLEEVMQTVNTVVLKMTEKILQREFSPADQQRILQSLKSELPTQLK